MADQRPVRAHGIEGNKGANRNDYGKHLMLAGCILASLDIGLGRIDTPFRPSHPSGTACRLRQDRVVLTIMYVRRWCSAAFTIG